MHKFFSEMSTRDRVMLVAFLVFWVSFHVFY